MSHYLIFQLLVQNGAQLEGSKEFAKNFNQTQHSTAAYDSFTAETVENGCKLETLQPPYVLKADG
jgi:phosphoribosylamine--glycine ligase